MILLEWEWSEWIGSLLLFSHSGEVKSISIRIDVNKQRKTKKTKSIKQPTHKIIISGKTHACIFPLYMEEYTVFCMLISNSSFFNKFRLPRNSSRSSLISDTTMK